MDDNPTLDDTSSVTEHALKAFFPGQKLSLKPFDGPEITFTVCKLFTPVSFAVVVLAKTDTEPLEQVVIKIYDPRYTQTRMAANPKFSYRSRPWKLVNEQAAAMARPQNSRLADDELWEMIPIASSPEELANFSPEERNAYYVLYEERLYRFLKTSYDLEFRAYERLYEFQGSVIPRLEMAGWFIPPDERAIQPPAIVFEHIPSLSPDQISSAGITPAIFEPLIKAVDSFGYRGIVHCEIEPKEVLLTPPEKPTRAVLIDFGCAGIRDEDDDEQGWWGAVGFEDDGRFIRRIVEKYTSTSSS